MRFVGNFHPEWGYLAPAPNFMRTARMVVVATAIGATAGAAVVLSLVDRSVPGSMADASKTLVVVHSLVQPAEAAAPAAPMAEPVAAATPAPVTPATSSPATMQASAPAAPAPTTPTPRVAAKISAPAPSEARTVSTPAAPATVAALAESPPATEMVAPATDMVTADPNASTAPKVGTAPAAKKLPATTATGQPVIGQAQAQHNPSVASAPKRKTAGNDGLAPILRRLFSAN